MTASSSAPRPEIFSPVVECEGTRYHSVFKLLVEIEKKRAYLFKGDMSTLFHPMYTKRDTFSSLKKPMKTFTQTLPVSHLWALFKKRYQGETESDMFEITPVSQDDATSQVEVDAVVTLDTLMLVMYILLTAKMPPDEKAMVTPLLDDRLKEIDYGQIFMTETHHKLDHTIVAAILFGKHFVTQEPAHDQICVSTRHRIWNALAERNIPMPSKDVSCIKLEDREYFLFTLEDFMAHYFSPLFLKLQNDLAINHDKVL